eukprot:NODE_123_length_18841_cov_0.279693.p10 type:complete len:150 gc:universal NODE_123_length_18841_cov_0.279693:16051-15602(-)
MDLSKILSCKKVLKKNLKMTLCKDDVDYLETTYNESSGKVETEIITKVAEQRCVIREKVRIWFCNRKRRDRLECLSEWKRIKEKAKCLFATSNRFDEYKAPITEEFCTLPVSSFLVNELVTSIVLLQEIQKFSKGIPNLDLFNENEQND